MKKYGLPHRRITGKCIPSISGNYLQWLHNVSLANNKGNCKWHSKIFHQTPDLMLLYIQRPCWPPYHPSTVHCYKPQCNYHLPCHPPYCLSDLSGDSNRIRFHWAVHSGASSGLILFGQDLYDRLHNCINCILIICLHADDRYVSTKGKTYHMNQILKTEYNKSKPSHMHLNTTYHMNII